MMGFIIFILIILTPAKLVADNITLTEQELHRKLFSFCNPNIMPIKNKSDTICISVDIFIINIDNIDEKSQIFQFVDFWNLTNQLLT